MRSKIQDHRWNHWEGVPSARGSLPLLIALLTVTSVGVLLNRQTYAIGDDYHFFGFYFALGGLNYREAVVHFWSSPFAAGRVFAPVFDLLPLAFMQSVKQFEWVRGLHLLLLLGICIQVFNIVKDEKRDATFAGLIVMCVISMPGVWHLFMVSYGTSMLVGTVVALVAAARILGNSSSFFQRWVVFGVLAFFVIFTYQPLWPLLFIGISKRIMYPKLGTQNGACGVKPKQLVRDARTYFGIIVVVACIFMMNYVLVRYGYNSPRLSAGIDLWAKIEHILVDLTPAAVYPWLYLFFPGVQWVAVLSWSTIALSLFLVFRGLWIPKANQKGDLHGLFRITLAVLLGTGLLPLSLGMYVFTDQAVGFRRVLFASIYFWIVFLLSLSAAVSRASVGKILHYVLWGGFISAAFIIGIFLDFSTQRLAAAEWRNAICATKLSPIKDETRIDRSAVLLPLPFPVAMNNDEVQVRTLAYPTGSMLIWLAHMESLDKRPAFSPWVLNVVDQPTADSWSRAYKNCAAKKQ